MPRGLVVVGACEVLITESTEIQVERDEADPCVVLSAG